MNRFSKDALLGSLVMVVLLAGCTSVTRGSTTTPASASAATTAVPTSATRPTSPAAPATSTAGPSPTAEGITEVLSDSSDGAVGITVTAPGYWSVGHWAAETGPAGFDRPAGAGIIAFVVDKKFFVYGDPCGWKSTRPTAPATTVDEIVAALANQALRNAAAPEEITLDGYSGKKITLLTPDDARFRDCDEHHFSTLGVAGEDPALWQQGRGEIDEIWVVDVNGRIVLLEGGYWAHTPQETVDELHAIVNSAVFNEAQ